jgi:hypothetical protein
VKIILAAVLALSALPAAAQMYKCVDERGVTHYSDKPQPPGCKGGPVDIKGSPPISGTVSKPPPVDEKVEAAKKAALDQRCANLRQEHAAVSGLGRIQMDEETREARLAAIKEQMKGCP